MRKILVRISATLSASLLVTVYCGPASAAMVLTLNDGVNPTITIMDNSALDDNADDGLIDYNGPLAGWMPSPFQPVPNIRAVSVPPYPPWPALGTPYLALGHNIQSTGPAALYLTVTSDSFLPDMSYDTFTPFRAYAGAYGSPDTTSMAVRGYYSAANATPPDSLLCSATGRSITPSQLYAECGGWAYLSAPYSLSLTYSLVVDRFSFQSGGAGLETWTVPEPASLGLLSLGLAVLGLGRLRRQRPTQLAR